MANTKKLTPTNVITLQKYVNSGEVVELPGWEEGVPFIVKLRMAMLRPLLMTGKIPNPLMSAAQRLYEGTGASKASSTYKQVVEVMYLVVREAMVEPTLAQLEEVGVELTEEQFGAIFSYAQRGAKALEPFRVKPASPEPAKDGEGVQNAAQ